MQSWWRGVKQNPALLPPAWIGQSCTDGTDRGDPPQRPSPPTGPRSAPRHGGPRWSSASRRIASALRTGAAAPLGRHSRESHGNPAGCRRGQTPLRHFLASRSGERCPPEKDTPGPECVPALRGVQGGFCSYGRMVSVPCSSTLTFALFFFDFSPAARYNLGMPCGVVPHVFCGGRMSPRPATAFCLGLPDADLAFFVSFFGGHTRTKTPDGGCSMSIAEVALPGGTATSLFCAHDAPRSPTSPTTTSLDAPFNLPCPRSPCANVVARLTTTDLRKRSMGHLVVSRPPVLLTFFFLRKTLPVLSCPVVRISSASHADRKRTSVLMVRSGLRVLAVSARHP